MLWFGKKKKEDKKTDEEDILFNEYAEDSTEEEILDALNEEEPAPAPDPEDESMFDSEITDNEEDELGEGEQTEEQTSDVQVTTLISSFDELCDFVNRKPIGYVQYMRKNEMEVFQLRDLHLRIASVWGSVSMSAEYSDKDYAKIMLACELLSEPDSFYVLPMLTESERNAAIMSFCLETYGENGKKYVKNTEKFAKLVKENDDLEAWLEYTEGLVRLKIERFCRKNGIKFDDIPENEGEDDDE